MKSKHVNMCLNMGPSTSRSQSSYTANLNEMKSLSRAPNPAQSSGQSGFAESEGSAVTQQQRHSQAAFTHFCFCTNGRGRVVFEECVLVAGTEPRLPPALLTLPSHPRVTPAAGERC